MASRSSSGSTPLPNAGPVDPGAADSLSPAEQERIRATDEADTARRAPAPKLKGKRIRAIPAVLTKSGDRGTTVQIRASDFESKGIKHSTITFDERKDSCTLRVGNGSGEVSQEAADFLTKNYPTSFEYMND